MINSPLPIEPLRERRPFEPLPPQVGQLRPLSRTPYPAHIGHVLNVNLGSFMVERQGLEPERRSLGTSPASAEG
jgi:hypothetical protein